MQELTFEAITDYVKTHPAAVLSTIHRDAPQGAVVYVCAESGNIYFLTKSETQKFKNIQTNARVSLTSVDVSDSSTLQIEGQAFIESNARIIDAVMQHMTRIYAASPDWLPPIAKLQSGAYQIVGIDIAAARLSVFAQGVSGGPPTLKVYRP